MAGSATASPRDSWPSAVSRSSSRMRQETPSTARWWMATKSRCGSHGSPFEEHGAHDGAAQQVQAGLPLGAHGLDGRRAVAFRQHAHVHHVQRHVGGEPRVLLRPASVGRAGKAQAQRVVVRHQRGQGALQHRRVHAVADAQQHGLVVVVRIGQLAAKEPGLHRGEPHRPRHRALLGLGHGRRPRHGGEAGDGLVLEYLLGRKPQAALLGAGDHLDGQDAVAAQLEEVVFHAHPLQAKHVGPHFGQRLFRGAAGGHVRLFQLLPVHVRRGKGALVGLAVAGQRQLVQHHKGAGDHVVGQALQQVAPQLGGPPRPSPTT